jgi:signal recognition particle GTPase
VYKPIVITHWRELNEQGNNANQFLVDLAKVRELRRVLNLRSNAEAVRRVIDDRLAVETGLNALRRLRKLGGLEEVFGRIPAKKK